MRNIFKRRVQGCVKIIVLLKCLKFAREKCKKYVKMIVLANYIKFSKDEQKNVLT